MMMIDRAERSIVWVSASFATRGGLDERDLMGRCVDDVFVNCSRLSQLLEDDDAADRRFDDEWLTINVDAGESGTELNLVSVVYIDGGSRAMLSFAVPDDGDRSRRAIGRDAATDHRYETLFRDATEGVVVHDGTRVVSANRAARLLVGWPDGTPVVGLPIARFVDTRDRGVLDAVRRRLADEPGSAQQVGLRLRRVDGDTIRVDAAIATADWGEAATFQLVMHQVSNWGPPLAAYDDGQLGSADGALVITDERLRIVEWNDAASRLYGWSSEEVRGRRISDVLGAPDRRLAVEEVVTAAVQVGARAEAVVHLRRDGSEVSVLAATTVRLDGSGEIAGLSVESRALRVESKPSSGWSGREALLASLASPQCGPLSVVIVFDVDDFNKINLRYGTAVGDDVLAAIWDRLLLLTEVDDVAVCLDGDRFAMRCRADTIVVAREIVARLERALTTPLEVSGVSLPISFSIGGGWGGSDPCLFEHAMTALRTARRQGGHRVCWFDAEQRPSDWSDDESFAEEMRAALLSGAIYVAFQPIVDLSSRRLLKVEALARWDHPVRGAVSPGTFIPMAERHGLIDELGAWVLQTSCSAVVAMHAAGIMVDVTVNLSPTQLHHPDVAECVAEALATAGLDPHRLWIEVTESVLVDDQAIEPLHRLHDLGVRLVIDDFGTGYATFQYLTRLPVDALKIDMSFVNGVGVDASDTAIVRSVIGLGRELGMQVVAEGVETESQRAQLLTLNCRLGQGWLFGRAIRLDEFIRTHNQPLPLAMESVGETNESLRLAALEACRVLDTDNEAAFDSLVQLASRLMSTPMAVISLIDADRQWFKARVGLEATETPRDISFCSHAIQQPQEAFVVADTALDERFANNPLVTGSPSIRAYAGIPICSREGLALGALCVLDVAPRAFGSDELALLTTLAEQAATLLDLRRRAVELHLLIQRLQSQHLEMTGAPDLVAGDPTAVAGVLTDLRRTSPPRTTQASDLPNVVRFGPLVVDLDARTISNAGAPVELDHEQFDLLAFLAARPGHVFHSTELCRRVWPAGQSAHDLPRIVRGLRAQIEPDPSSPALLCSAGTDMYRFGPAFAADSARHQPPPTPRSGTWTHVDGRIVAVDDEMLSMVAASRDDVVGRDVFEFVAVSSQPATHARLEMRAFGHAPGPQLITMQATDGHQFSTLVESKPTELEPEQSGVLVSFLEVLDPPQLLRQFVSSVLNEVSDAVIVTDTDLHVLSWNRAAERLYGWTEPHVLGHSLDDVIRPLDPSEREDARNQLERTGQWAHQTRQLTRDGVTVSVRTSVNLIRDETGSVTGIVSVNRPIDEPDTPSTI